MRISWKITIGAVTILAILAFVASFFTYMSPGTMAPPDESDLQYMEPQTQPDPLHNVDKLLDKMQFGAIAFNVPKNINIEDSPQIQLILSLAETIEELKILLTEEGYKIGATIRVSDRMEARLTGYMFQITATDMAKFGQLMLQNGKWNNNSRCPEQDFR